MLNGDWSRVTTWYVDSTPMSHQCCYGSLFELHIFQVAMICGGPRADNFLKQFGRELFMDVWLLLEGVKFYNMVGHNCHGKTKNLTAKPKTSRQIKTKYFTAKSKQLWFCRRYLLLPWDIWCLLWSIWFCREVFGFVVRYFVFAVRFSVLPWGILFLPWGFWFCRDSCGPPYYKE